MSKQPPKVSDVLRTAILNADETRYALSKRSGIGEPILSRFINGKRTLRLETVDVLCEALGLELIAQSKRTRKGN